MRSGDDMIFAFQKFNSRTIVIPADRFSVNNCS